MDKEQAKLLLQRYRMGLCTAAEAASIEAWYEEKYADSDFQWTEEERILFEQTLHAHLQQALFDEDASIIALPARNRKIWWYAAAVFFALLLSGTAYWLQHRDSPAELAKQGIAQRYHNDVPPGQTGAWLTLADGQRIQLESKGTELISTQGSTAIHHQDGQLAYLPQDTKGQAIQNTLSTPKGRQFALLLADGTRVWLNAGSSVTFPVAFTDSTREVSLTGEAYFEVAKNPARPFIVHAAGTDTRVLGTHFNINAYPDEPAATTTLMEGAVQLSSSGNTVLLHPDEQGILQEGRLTVGKEVDSDLVLAWHKGFLSFDNADIRTIMRQLARWYDIEVSYAAAIPKETFWGDLRRDASLSEVLRVLEKSGVKFTIEGRQVTVL